MNAGKVDAGNSIHACGSVVCYGYARGSWDRCYPRDLTPCGVTYCDPYWP